MGTPSRLSDSELVCLAVVQALLGCHSEARWLRYTNKHLSDHCGGPSTVITATCGGAFRPPGRGVRIYLDSSVG